MRHGVPTCTQPTDKDAMYMRCMFHEFFWGPFKTEEEVAQAIRTLDKADPYWDYDCFCMIYGADPLPSDFVNGFLFVAHETRRKIEAMARPNEAR